MNETPITIVGNAVEDASLRFTPSGAAVANLRVASNPRKFNRQTNEFEDGEPLFLAVSCWRQHAENVAETVKRGDRVIVTGHLVQKQFEAKDGGKRSSYEIADAEIGISLLRATANVTRNAPSGNGGQGGQQRPAQQQSGGGWGTATGATTATDPWATQGQAEPPF